MFLMHDSAMTYLRNTDGWEIGVGPSVVLVDQGMARSITTTTLSADIYAFVFDQSGLMAGAGLQSSKITRIQQWLRACARTAIALKRDLPVRWCRWTRKSAARKTGARKKDLSSRPATQETQYEITLKTADQPGLPQPVSAANASHQPDSPDSGLESLEPAQSAKRLAADSALQETERILLDSVALLDSEENRNVAQHVANLPPASVRDWWLLSKTAWPIGSKQ
jgi:hypothetical protein